MTTTLAPSDSGDRDLRARIQWRSSLPFLAVHIMPLAAFITGITARAVVLFLVLCGLRMFCVTAGYHRYFAHRSYRVSRPVQALLAFGGTTAAQKGPLWWAAHHRAHHRHTDRPGDAHSPGDGFWWSRLERHDWIGPWALAVLSVVVGGWSGLVVGFFASTVVVWHATFAVNSIAHLVGRRRYDTLDTRRASASAAASTFGERWHHHHHRFPAAARRGHAWWDLDLTNFALRLLAAVGLARDLGPVPTVAPVPTRRRQGRPG